MIDSQALFMRPAELTDARHLARLRSASLAELGLLEASRALPFERTAEAELQRMLRASQLAAWLLVARYRIVGSACIVYWQRLPYAESSLHAELAGVYVDPQFRRRGFARELCREALALARARGVRRVVVHPSTKETGLYRELGFATSNEMRLD